MHHHLILDTVLHKIHDLAARSLPEFRRYDAPSFVEALKNAAQDSQRTKAGYYRLTFETLRGKMDQTNQMFHDYLLPLLDNKDHE